MAIPIVLPQELYNAYVCYEHPKKMNKTRLEAFSDGVFAIIITIMVLELKAPVGTGWTAIKPLVPVFLSYLLSFVFIAIYWVNHHHLMHTAKKVNASIMWANIHLLFWLSLIPFATGWMGVNNFDRIAVACYGAMLLLCGIAFNILSYTIRKTYKEETALSTALARSNTKGWISAALYALSIFTALFVHPFLSAIIFASVSIMWLIPSKEIEHALNE